MALDSLSGVVHESDAGRLNIVSASDSGDRCMNLELESGFRASLPVVNNALIEAERFALASLDRVGERLINVPKELILANDVTYLVCATTGLVFAVTQYKSEKISVQAMQINGDGACDLNAGYIVESENDGNDEGVSSHRFLKARDYTVGRDVLAISNAVEGPIREDLWSLELIRFYNREGYMIKFCGGRRFEDEVLTESEITRRLISFMIDKNSQVESPGVSCLLPAPEEAGAYWKFLSTKRNDVLQQKGL